MDSKLIVGLGNPGTRYQWTRHNAGFMVLDRFSHVSGIQINRKCFSGVGGEGSWKGLRLFLLKPQTYMNLSGKSVAEAMRFYKIPVENLIVIHDDLDLSFGKAKIKQGGGHGGHNGLRSLISDIGNRDFVRIRIGIDRPIHGDPTDYVLGTFNKSEEQRLLQLLDGIVDMLECLLTEGLEKSMSKFNNRDLLSL
jgi:PTH1 family peptidyl-tRNA hydrolase